MPDENRKRPTAVLLPRPGDRVHVCRETAGRYEGTYIQIQSVMNSVGLPRGNYFVWGQDACAYQIFYDHLAKEWREYFAKRSRPKPPA